MSNSGGDISGFTLGSFVRSLCLGKLSQTRPSGRVYTYLFGRFDAPIPILESDLFALHAARHYTTEYVLSEDLESFRRVRDFATVNHTVTLEGTATVISPASDGDPMPGFLKNFKTHTFRAHYLPITILALHERGFLVDKTSTALLTASERRDSSKMRERFRALTRESLDFRIYFRFSEVSVISMHNALNRALREVLGLDRMSIEFNRDIVEISDFLQRQDLLDRAEQEHRRSRRFWYFSVIGTGVLGALAVSTLVKEGLQSWPFIHKLAEQGVSAFGENEGPGFIAFVVGILILLGACVLGIVKRPPKHAPGLLGEHAAHDFGHHAGQHFIIEEHHELN